MRTALVLFGWFLAAYLLAGVGFAGAFHGRGLVRVDPAARGAGWLFRVLVTPGIVALWPWLAWRWRQGPFSEEQEAVRRAHPLAPERLRALHGLAWKLLAVLVPFLLAAALAGRPGPSPTQDVPGVEALVTR